MVRSAHGQTKQLLSLAGHCMLESALFPAAFTLLLLHTHPSEVAPNTKGRKKKTQPVNNNINCHQWSEQCCKSLLNHRMSMLRKFPFSLKPCYRQGQRSCMFLSLLHQGSLGRSVPSPFSTPYPDSITRPSRNTDIVEAPYNKAAWPWRKRRIKDNEWSNVFKETGVT